MFILSVLSKVLFEGFEPRLEVIDSQPMPWGDLEQFYSSCVASNRP
ncbi:hypothetical protein VCRA2110O318_260022 [Vibrio crassostreae]|nr:hypothetical protein VCRA2117O328_250021 [Vibrio crassostreae]CAK2309012.1 hypothetical protein VCRA2110O318_260022 [Vibrio crassostreae]CAK2458505.1 hypothetical protein VCRA2110O319_250021 [Vibrio crassostreae]CAK2821018.1 hypothetical protein VCRA217O317_280047 [Vibrio crassostreae]